jgi:hypothetical protein
MTGYTTGAGNRMLTDNLGNSYTYDNEGNVVAKGGWTYAYDNLNRLTSATSGGTSISFKRRAATSRFS